MNPGCCITLRTILLIPIFIALAGDVQGQTIYCPPNFDFEQGNLSNWVFYTGSCCPINTPNQTTPVNNRHTLTSGTGTDIYGGFPIVAPGSGSYSLKLGNDGIGKQAERARYYVHVPSTPGYYIFIYKYAVVFQDPSHAAKDQPRFEVRAYDSATGVAVPCNTFVYVATSSIPGFTKSNLGKNVWYKPWTTASINLSDYNGRTIALDFASGDCALGAHFGYGYVDMSCQLYEISASRCPNSPYINLTGPPGFETYKWMDTSFTTVLDTLQTATISSSVPYTKFAVIVTPYSGLGCPDTFYTDIVNVNTKVTPMADTTVCYWDSVKLKAKVTTNASSYTYEWKPVNSLTCSTCAEPTAQLTTTTVIDVIITDNYGCKDTGSTKITVPPPPQATVIKDTGACYLDTVELAAWGGIKFKWTPAAGLSSTTVPNPVATVTGSTSYKVEVTDALGCKDTNRVNISLYPAAVANAGPDVTVCRWDTVKLSGSGGISYDWLPPIGLDDANKASPTATVDTDRVYALKVTNYYGCTDTDSVALSTYPSPVADAGPDTLACLGLPVQLSGSGGGAYLWYPATNMTNSTTPTPTVYVYANIKYNLVVTNNNGCHDTDEVNVTLARADFASATNGAGCPGEEVSLAAYGGIQYKWYPSAGLDSINTSTPKTVVSGNTTYYVEVTDTTGCKDTAMAQVFQYDLPVADAGADTAVCPGKPFVLKGSGGIAYKWYPSKDLSSDTIASPTVTTTAAITYNLQVTNQFGCKDTDQVAITIVPVSFAIDSVQPICKGETVALNASGGDVYTWSPTYGLSYSNQPNPVAGPDSSMVYTVVITESLCARSDTLSTSLEVLPLPVIEASANDIDCGSEAGKLQAVGAVEYRWIPDYGLSTPDQAFTFAAPEHTTVYTVEGRGENGCVDTSSVTLHVFEGEGRLFAPDVFTPNGDGINDCYRVYIPGTVTEFELAIYNRWGERVYFSHRFDHCWDGTYEGVPAELSTYFYYYKANSSSCGRIFKKGDIHLVR